MRLEMQLQTYDTTDGVIACITVPCSLGSDACLRSIEYLGTQ